MKPDVPVWHGCYAESWNGWIVPEAFSHPAKFARGLIRRTLEHGIERGYWQPSQLIGDPFGGVACGGIVASSLGFRWVGNELEAKFVAIGKQNIELHRDWYAIGKPRPVLLQGDSRRFHEIIGQAFADGALTSPPYADSLRRQEDGIDWEKCKYEPGSGLHQGRGDSLHATYGDDPAQIAKLRKGGLDAAVTSPPFTTDQPRASQNDLSKGRGKPGDAREHHMDAAENIQNLAPGQIDHAVTSPPWEKNCEGGRAGHKLRDPLASKRGNGASDAAVLAQAERDAQKTYGDSDGQIGQLERGDTCFACGKSLNEKTCRTVKIAELLSTVEAVGANAVTEPISGGREYQKAKITKLKSPPPISECQNQTVLGQRIHTGLAEQAGGEDTHGACSEERRSNETAENASIAEPLTTSLSTTEKTNTKPGESGITALEIFKRFAEAVTQRNTPERESHIVCCARCASSLTSPKVRTEELVLRVVKRLLIPPSTTDGLQGVGRESGETYFVAMKKVYASLFLALKPGGVAAIVVKDYVKDKQRVRLCDDTLRLLEHVGFVAIERAHAMLVEHSEHHDLFAGTVQTKKERKSFFRRLAEKKGSPPIDYEEVLFVRRPCASPS